MLIALTRSVPPSIVECELTHLAREPIDVARATVQHRAYENTLASLGYTVRHLPDEPELPDSVFVEDTAVVVDEVAVITRPGAASRRRETLSVAQTLRTYRDLVFIDEPATLDGGDVLRIGKRFFAGRSERTNDLGIAQLRAHLAPFGYSVEAVTTMRNCLHLKTAVTAISDSVLLMNPDWIGMPGFECVFVDPSEPFAANALLTPCGVVMPAAFPRTIERVRRHGIKVDTVEASELAKAEGGVTCCSLLLNHD
ncbi:MAG TPA: arginine deiminase family protein [Thermoanaerobaculia bacterium]|nr:arginine deiminase family protein [Thermoanaerobaculia bacterium]